MFWKVKLAKLRVSSVQQYSCPYLSFCGDRQHGFVFTPLISGFEHPQSTIMRELCGHPRLEIPLYLHWRRFEWSQKADSRAQLSTSIPGDRATNDRHRLSYAFAYHNLMVELLDPSNGVIAGFLRHTWHGDAGAMRESESLRGRHRKRTCAFLGPMVPEK